MASTDAKTIVGNAQATAEMVPEFDVVDLSEFIAVDEPGAVPLVGEGDMILIPENADVMFYGRGGAGKTTLVLDLAFHIAAGDDWLGIPIAAPARVLVIENEGPRALFRKKLKTRHAAWHGSPIAPGFLPQLNEPWGRVRLDSPGIRARLAENINRRELDVIAIGPISRSGMNEAGTLQQVRDFMELIVDVRTMADRRVTFLLVHHENRAGQVSGAWEPAVDTLFHVQGQGHGFTRLFVEKARWSSEQHNKSLRLAWTEGGAFEAVEGDQNDDNALADNMLEFVLANGGAAWTKIENDPSVKGQGQRLRGIRDTLLAGGRLLNLGTEKRMQLWHPDDPSIPTFDQQALAEDAA